MPNGFQTGSRTRPGNDPVLRQQNQHCRDRHASMLYSTYFGGGNPVRPLVHGGGIAVDDPSGNMYFTGTTNMPGVTGPNGEVEFPLFNAYQSCLNESADRCLTPTSHRCYSRQAESEPTSPRRRLLYSTYLGGSGTTSALRSRSIPRATPMSRARPIPRLAVLSIGIA